MTSNGIVTLILFYLQQLVSIELWTEQAEKKQGLIYKGFHRIHFKSA